MATPAYGTSEWEKWAMALVEQEQNQVLVNVLTGEVLGKRKDVEARFS